MGRKPKALALLASAHPAILDPRQAPFVERRRTPGALQPVFSARVEDHEDEEDGSRGDQPPGCDDDLAEHKVSDHRARDAGEQPRVADFAGQFLFARSRSLPIRQPT